MKRLARLSRSGIEYLTHVWNFYSGCHHKENDKCPSEFKCWAQTSTERFKSHYPNGFQPTFYPEAFLAPMHLKKPSRIGVCFMGDLFGDWVDPEQWIEYKYPHSGVTLKERIQLVIKDCPQHRFLFLTKNPAGLLRWLPFPENCWVGFSACNREMLLDGCRIMQTVEARVKWISIEPLLEDTWCLPSTLTLAGINWVVIGAQTQPWRSPSVEWVKNIVEAADKAGAKVWLKNNLLLNISGADKWALHPRVGYGELYRQELPE